MQIETDLLDIAFEDSQAGEAVFLLHGWPDAPCGWKRIALELQRMGWRTIAPYLRGSEPTRFRSAGTLRDGTAVALAQDVIDLANGLDIQRFAVVGHDWGARVAYTLAALFPDRVSTIAALSVAYQPHGVFNVPDFEQSRRFWYQWFLCVDRAKETVERDPVGFARIQWETWSPSGWFTEQDFAATAKSFTGPDWLSITLNSYRSRWLGKAEPVDPRYEKLRDELAAVDSISVPTLMIQGASDFCDPPSESQGRDKYFTGGYERIVLENVGHFPHREAPGRVVDQLARHLRLATY
jgi:pimeloyl-ACP methyl ester carboxylesterase